MAFAYQVNIAACEFFHWFAFSFFSFKFRILDAFLLLQFCIIMGWKRQHYNIIKCLFLVYRGRKDD